MQSFMSGRRACCGAATNANVTNHRLCTVRLIQRPRKTNEVGLHVEGEGMMQRTHLVFLTKETHQPCLRCGTAGSM